MDPEVIARLLARDPGDGVLAARCPREREVLALMAEGRSNAAIAQRLVITERAIAKHTASSAACGGQMDRMMSACRVNAATVPASRSLAASALAALAGPCPADAHSTGYPAATRQPATAAPISPGCSSPICTWPMSLTLL
jgi:hypothetical protein